MDDNRWHKKTGPGQIMAQYTCVPLASGLLMILEVSFSTGFCRKIKPITRGQSILEAWYAWAMGCTAQVHFFRQLCKLADFKQQQKKPKVNALLLQKQNQSSYKFLISAREQFDPSSTKIWYIGLTCIYPSHLNINMHTLPTFSIHFLRCWQGELD